MPPSGLNSTSRTPHAAASSADSPALDPHGTPSTTLSDPATSKKRAADTSSSEEEGDDDGVPEKRARHEEEFSLEPFDFRDKLPQNWFIQIPSTSVPTNPAWGNDFKKFLWKYGKARKIKADSKAWYLDFGDGNRDRDDAKECYDNLVGKKFNRYLIGMRLYGYTPKVRYQVFRSTLEEVEVAVEIPGKRWWDRP